MRIRPYVPTDYPDVKQNLEDGLLYEDAIDNPESLARKIALDPQSILVAEDDGHAIGNIILCYDGWCALAWHLAVRKEYRGRDIGLHLMQEAERILTDRGAPYVAAFVDMSKTTLVAYYERQGFERGPGSFCSMSKVLK